MQQDYNLSGAYVYAGESDAQPLSLIEALSHGIPAVAYDINYGPKDVIKDGRNGYLVKNGAVNQLVTALTKVLENPQRQQKMSDAAYRSSTQYSSDAVWKQWQVIVKK